MSETIYEDAHCTVERVEPRVIVVRRQATHPSAAELQRSLEAAMAHAGPDDRRCGLIVDLRLAVGRNDPEFEARLEPTRRALERAFYRTVTLVRSAAGELQVRRLARDERREYLVTRDWGEALRLARPPS